MKVRMLRETCVACFMLLVLSLATAAQVQPAMKDADALYQAQKWAEAAKAYEAITKNDPSNGRAWNRLGSALQSMGQYEQAIEAYQHAARIGGNPATMYSLATVYAKTNKREQAFEWLRKAVASGFAQVKQLETESALSVLRDDSRFKEIVAGAQKNATPCAFTPEHRQFDFWVGEWDVQNPPGQFAGTNSIQLMLGNCVIYENWTSATGAYAGKSFNLYNPTLKKWQQFWADDKGGVLEFSGEYKDNELRYTGESLDPKGNKIMHRMTYFNLSPDRMRQLWEQSTDNARTWTVAFDGLYIRKK